MEKKQKNVKKLMLAMAIIFFVTAFFWTLRFIMSLTGEKEKLIFIILHGLCAVMYLAVAIASLIRYKKLKKAEMQISAEKAEN